MYIRSDGAGVPVIASKVGGIPDICRDGIDGLLIEPGDVIGLSAAIDKLFADSTLRNRIIQSALGRINTEFVMEVVLADLGRIYSQLGAKPKSIQ
ncbi:glycosyltransferase [Chitinibacter fontanus]|uniref:Glycosyltransferase n=1 Tax=Chitinibacter fontanus TaxID=1737446 RepID=A0A7D5VB51_9NEIS|nr:glycosyltransferase [Chitinibacter fontanus]QLI82555.1 glycosyltransferase [Chitinibacter fontanus]